MGLTSACRDSQQRPVERSVAPKSRLESAAADIPGERDRTTGGQARPCGRPESRLYDVIARCSRDPDRKVPFRRSASLCRGPSGSACPVSARNRVMCSVRSFGCQACGGRVEVGERTQPSRPRSRSPRGKPGTTRACRSRPSSDGPFCRWQRRLTRGRLANGTPAAEVAGPVLDANVLRRTRALVAAVALELPKRARAAAIGRELELGDTGRLVLGAQSHQVGSGPRRGRRRDGGVGQGGARRGEQSRTTRSARSGRG